MKYDWRNEDNKVKHYYRTSDGKILGTVWQYVNNTTVWCSKILDDRFPFTNESEKFLGRYVSQEFAEKSIEKFWSLQDSTVSEQKNIKGVIDAS